MKDKAKWADQWFDDLERIIRTQINRYRKDCQKPVRVAVLDTGIDVRHPEFQRAVQLKRLREARGFPDCLDPYSDRSGYGTHGASVLMRTAPHSVLYVARIANDDRNIVADDNYVAIVEAINWCVENQVDVISIPIGIKGNPLLVKEALNNAHRKGIIILAPASNDGDDRSIAFSACPRNVFWIGSADGRGSRSNFSPPNLGEEKYSALGEEVLGAWPLSSDGIAEVESRCRQSGNSTAVVVAAGITAFLIDYTRQFVGFGKGAENWDNLRKIFLKMSEKTAGESYRYLSLKNIFNSNNVKALIRSIIIEPADKQWISNIPYSVKDPLWLVHSSIERNLNFVERRVVTCDVVWACLQQFNRVILSGLPGVGKTELASQLIWQARESRKYAAIFWLNAASITSFQSGMLDLARRMKLIDETQVWSTEANNIQDMVRQELNYCDQWLLVIDNLVEASLIHNFLPQRRESRHVLITTRFRGISSTLKAEKIDLNPMEQNEAISLFRKTAHRRQEQSLYSEPQLLELVNALGCLPLAVVQAATYLSETQGDMSNYFQFYKSSRRHTWNWKPLQGSLYVTVVTVTAIPFGKAKESEVEIRLFCWFSFLDSENVSETLWTKSEKFYDPLLRDTFDCPAEAASALQSVLTHKFFPQSGGNVSIHTLAQDVMQCLIEQDMQDQVSVLDILDDLEQVTAYWAQRLIQLISITYPMKHSNGWTCCEIDGPYAKRCLKYEKTYVVEPEMLGDLQRSMGKYMYDQGGYEQAKELFESALYIYERVCGEDNVKKADTLSDFGRSLAQLGKHQLAIEHYKLALRIADIEFHKNPVNLACVLRDIGKSLFGLGKYDEALQSLDMALMINEGAASIDRLESAQIIAAIGAVFLSKKQFKKALKNCEQALRIHEHSLGRDHVESAGLICLLGVISHRQGRYRRALRRFEQAMNIYERGFGKDNIKSAEAIDSMGLSFLHLGRCHQALEIFERELSIAESAFGKGHIKTESAVCNIAASYLFSGKRNEALKYYEQSLVIYGARLCEFHQKEASGVCVTKENFLLHHTLFEPDGKLNPLIKNHLKSIKLVEKLRLACNGKGVKGKIYRLVVKLLPLGIRLYGKYNEIESIAVPGVFEFVEPSLYGI